LELANSAWYKRRREIATVKDAITVIGLSALHQLVFATSVTRLFHGLDSEKVNMERFWHESERLACCSKLIAEANGLKDPIRMFTCGLLANIGKLVIYMSLPQASQQILERSESAPERQHETEQAVLGFTHVDVSAGLLKKWDLPESIHQPVQFQIHPANAAKDHRQSAAILSIARAVVYSDSASTDIERVLSGQEDIAALGDISLHGLDELYSKIDDCFREARSILGLP
jgi:HD-like signal output (HDOD) protein